MKVYILIKTVDYECSTVLDVYASEDDAKDAN